MRWWISLAAVALALLVAVPSASAHGCDARWFANHTYSVSQASGVSCAQARSYVRGIRGISNRFRVHGFTCRQYGSGLSFRCTRNGASFRFKTIA
jgi:hypothetical protein